MVVLRRIIVLAGVLAGVVHCFVTHGTPQLAAVLAVAAGVCGYNEVGRWLVLRGRPVSLPFVVNVQVGFDMLALVTLLHLGSGVSNHGVLFFAPMFFAYGAVLPLGQALSHVAAAM